MYNDFTEKTFEGSITQFYLPCSWFCVALFDFSYRCRIRLVLIEILAPISYIFNQ